MAARTLLQVKVIPGASTTAISGWLGDTLKVRVSAPPEKGKANRAVIELLSRSLGIDAGSVRVLRGATSQIKALEIDGVSPAEVRRRLDEPG